MTESSGLISGVAPWGDCPKFLLDGVGDLEGSDEILHRLLVNALARAGERLESLIWIWITLAAENGLDSFGHYGPVLFQICVEGILIENELAETLAEGCEGNQAVGYRHADIPENGGVGEVALQS